MAINGSCKRQSSFEIVVSRDNPNFTSTAEKKRYMAVLSCLDAISAIPQERHNLDFNSVATLFPYVQARLKGGKTVQECSVRKYFVDTKTRQIVIVSGKHGRSHAKYPNKKISDAVILQLHKGRPPTARAAYWVTAKKGHSFLTDDQLKLEKAGSHAEGVISFKRKDGSKTSGLLLKADTETLRSMLSSLSPNECLTISSQLIAQLRDLHEGGFVHGNIRAENVGVERQADGSLVSTLMNFDKAYDPSRSSEDFTSHSKKLQDPVAQAEARDKSALGCLLIELYKRKTVFTEDEKVSSKTLLNKLHKEIKGLSESVDKELLKAAVTLHVDAPKKASSLDDLILHFAALKIEK